MDWPAYSPSTEIYAKMGYFGNVDKVKRPYKIEVPEYFPATRSKFGLSDTGC
jgi:hypothetical protein